MAEAPGTDLRIEALRGSAALLVVVAHYAGWLGLPAWVPGLASTGVDLFFVLSGFVFAPYLVGAGWHYGAHLVRRLFRLYPLYLVALAVYVALKWPAADATAQLGVHLLMLHTLGAPEVAFFYNPAFWSLPPELEFYLLLPLVAWAVRRFGLGPVLVAAVGLRVALLAPLPWLMDSAPAAAQMLRTATVHLPGLLCEFLLGAWVALQARAGASPWRAPLPSTAKAPFTAVPVDAAWGVAAAMALAMAVLAALLLHAVAAPGRSAGVSAALGGGVGLLAAGAYAAALHALLAWRWQVAAAPSGLGAALAVWAGHLSYGVYLLHNAAPPLLQRLAPSLQGPALAAAALALTLLAAWALHLAVERPLRQWGRRLGSALAAPGR